MIKTQLRLPNPQSHKGQNGKLLIVGGSRLFHAASLWSAQVAAHLVDMVFYASVDENNQLIKIAKNNFRDGIVIERAQIMEYASEADVILLGPGLTRGSVERELLAQILSQGQDLTPTQWQESTYLITNFLLARFPQAKFVLDAGALQMVEIEYLTQTCILTPHQLEWQQLRDKAKTPEEQNKLDQTVILSKNVTDKIYQGGQLQVEIRGGNAGLTKGGSGDALAGLVAGLYAYNDALTACEWASTTVKTAADTLYREWGPFYTTTQVARQAPRTLWQLYQRQAGT
jgi:NAD(P)H-hydrate epimerase